MLLYHVIFLRRITISLSKRASKKFSVLRSLQNFFTLHQLNALYRGVVHPCVKYCTHLWWVHSHGSPWKEGSRDLKTLSLLLSPVLSASPTAASLYTTAIRTNIVLLLSNKIPSPLRITSATRLSTSSHPFPNFLTLDLTKHRNLNMVGNSYSH